MSRCTSITRQLTLVALACLLAAPARAQVQRNGGLPTPNPLFPDDNWWNRDVRCAPVDPNSANFIDFIGPGVGMHPDFGGDDPDNAPNGIYGMVYITVSAMEIRSPPQRICAAPASFRAGRRCQRSRR